MGELFPLWSFDSPRYMFITRGRTQEEALQVLRYNMKRGGDDPSWLRCMNFNPVSAARDYSQNHAPGWLERPPYCIEHGLLV